MVTRTLTGNDFDVVHATFLEAFSDYLVPLALTREQLAEMMTRRGWVPEASVGIFDGERMVAFTLNGIEGDRAYDSGTGVVPSHRRRGLGKEMIDFVEPVLRGRGCAEYVLEVLEPNEKAIGLYLGAGFRETRRFQCWRLECGGDAAAFESGSAAAALQKDWWDVEPSWQNSSASIRRAKDTYRILGNEDGYVVVFPSNGDIPQLAVRPEARRRGLGTRLLQAAAAAAGKPLRIVNVEDHPGIAAFLEAAGAVRTVRQIEMVKPL